MTKWSFKDIIVSTEVTIICNFPGSNNKYYGSNNLWIMKVHVHCNRRKNIRKKRKLQSSLNFLLNAHAVHWGICDRKCTFWQSSITAKYSIPSPSVVVPWSKQCCAQLWVQSFATRFYFSTLRKGSHQCCCMESVLTFTHWIEEVPNDPLICKKTSESYETYAMWDSTQTLRWNIYSTKMFFFLKSLHVLSPPTLCHILCFQPTFLACYGLPKSVTFLSL